VGSRFGLETEAKVIYCPCRKSNPGRPSRSLSLYPAILDNIFHSVPSKFITGVVSKCVLLTKFTNSSHSKWQYVMVRLSLI
jgi:hypothetical protein